MSKKTITIDGKEFNIEANASTIIIYEDSFKGHRFLQDLDELQKIKEPSDMPLGVCCRFIWAVAKTADSSIPDMLEWTKGFSMGGIFSGVQPAIEIIGENVAVPSKNLKTATEEK